MAAFASRTSTRLLPIAALAVSLLWAASAQANGKFPATEQLLVDPGDPDHLVLRTNFGLVTSSNGGRDWDWVCEKAVGYVDYEPPVGVTDDGTVFAGLKAGVNLTHRDTCEWAPVAGTIETLFVPDVSVARFDPTLAVAITSVGGGGDAKYWESTDQATTWTAVGAPLPTGFLPNTVDVAPSDPSRIYASGLMGPPGNLQGAFARSIDHGTTWETFPLSNSDPATAPYIGAVDPAVADTVYVRLDGAPGRLLVTHDGGANWSEAFVGSGFLKSFALSPDGAVVLVGGETDGVWRADGAALAFEKVSTAGVRCLTWSPDRLYACARDNPSGFFVATSDDMGSTFTPLLHMQCIKPRDCAPETSVGAICPQYWPAIEAQIAVEPCGAGGSGSGAATVASSGSGASDAGPSVASGANATDTASESSGCGCRVVGGSNEAWCLISVGSGLAALGIRRRRRGTRVFARR